MTDGSHAGAPSPAPAAGGAFRNFTSFAGLALIIASILGILFLFVAGLLGSHQNPYLGIFAFIVFPAILVIGLLVALFGAWRERRRRKRGQGGAFPTIDLNDPQRRRAVLFAMGGLLLFIFVSAIGSYQAFEFSESVEFCGQVCHEVMNPEFVAYQNSPHARVRCVDCHVGPGAGWYVRSKLSGAYQVYAATFDLFPRPIPTPIANLRPAQETCEQCHWPEKFFGAQLKVFNRYSYDETNTFRQTRMLINTGGGRRGTTVQGIHWHMNINNQVSYIAADDKRQVIPWVEIRDRSGKVEVYRLVDDQGKPVAKPNRPAKIVDCVECHNRPSHIYHAPDISIDDALFAGRIDPTLPFIKREGVALLTRAYATTEQAVKALPRDLAAFYRTNYPDVASGKARSIDAAGRELVRIYTTNFFPEMKVDFRTHANNIGHIYNPGCFRCHDGKHVSSTGKVIRKDCNICHETLDEMQGGRRVPVTDGSYTHPLDFYGGLDNHLCTDCHTGAGATFPRFKHVEGPEVEGLACSDCHERTEAGGAPAAAADTATASN